MRFAVDTGGTFTDLIVEDDNLELHMFKAPTTPGDPIQGVLASLRVAASAFNLDLGLFLSRGSMFLYGTTHPINAVITGRTARTAFLTSEGHPDVLVLREGGRIEPFNFTIPFPQPYIPRSLTWEIPGRILPNGSVFKPIDISSVLRTIEDMREKEIEAVGVCLLWSIVNPEHECQVGELLDAHLPGVAYTLSHRLNPCLREYRRASSTCIDASLKPMMMAFMSRLDQNLRDHGFAGRVLAVTSQGGVMDAGEVATTPIHLLNSGPSMAPVAGRHFANVDEQSVTAIIADTGGTTYDVSLVRGGRIPWSRETWVGHPFRGHMTGFPSVDVKSVGAGGGSIAWVDQGGMLHVGPQSAGAVPGPACYAQGGALPTVTDAALVLGYLDPDFFLGGKMHLHKDAARSAVDEHIAKPLSMTTESAAAAIVSLVTENMVQAIMDITVNQGIDPRKATLIGGGGAAGLNSVLIARRLESRQLLIPEVGAALSATGAMMSDLTSKFSTTLFTRVSNFDYTAVNAALASLNCKCQIFLEGPGATSFDHTVHFSAEARYPEQVWEIDVALPFNQFIAERDVRIFVEEFHRAHDELFGFHDKTSDIEIVGWSATVSCNIRGDTGGSLAPKSVPTVRHGTRKAYFPENGWVDAIVARFEGMDICQTIHGPAIIESSFTTVVLNPGAHAVRRPSGSLSIDPGRNQQEHSKEMP